MLDRLSAIILLSAGIIPVASFMLINALRIRYPTESARWTPPLFRWRDCLPNVTFSTVSAPACQENHIFPTNFNNSCLSPISSILHRCARVTFPMVWRTRRFVAVKNAIYFHCFFNNFTFCYHATFKILALSIDFMVPRDDQSPSIIATLFRFLQENPMFFFNIFS